MDDAKLVSLGKYEIRRTLGRGAMGTVYEGWDPAIARKVAIKTVRIPDASDTDAQEELARFRREAQAAGRLNHPSIVGVFDYGETTELAYIVMEFVDGHTLKSVLDKQERFALPDTVRVMQDVLEGLRYSHEHGVVHRDIKPANLILASDGRAKIADFGIARIESSSMTQAGTVLGTPAYMSPEQFMGQVVTARSDLYSAGVVLYQMLTGERPFEGSLTSIMHKVLHTHPPKPSDLAVTVPPGMDAVVERAMARRPEDRFASAAEFAQALREAAHAGPAPPAAAVKTPAADATVVAAPPRAAAPAQPAPAAPPARASRVPVAAAAGIVLLAILGGGVWLALSRGPPHQSASPAQQSASLDTKPRDAAPVLSPAPLTAKPAEAASAPTEQAAAPPPPVVAATPKAQAAAPAPAPPAPRPPARRGVGVGVGAGTDARRAACAAAAGAGSRCCTSTDACAAHSPAAACDGEQPGAPARRDRRRDGAVALHASGGERRGAGRSGRIERTSWPRDAAGAAARRGGGGGARRRRGLARRRIRQSRVLPGDRHDPAHRRESVRQRAVRLLR